MKIGVLIYKIRESKNMKRADLAKGICSTKYIYMIENNERMPSINMLFELSKRLEFNFFDMVPYLSVENPIILKSEIDKFIDLRLNDDIEGIENNIHKLKESSAKRNPEFQQLISFHKSYVALKKNQISNEVIESLEASLALTLESSVPDLDDNYLYSYTELMTLTMFGACKFQYMNIYNISFFERIYKACKSLIKPDDAADVAFFVIDVLFEIYDIYKYNEKKEEYKSDFILSYYFNKNKPKSDVNQITLNKLLSKNIHLVSDYSTEIVDGSGNLLYSLSFLKPNIFIAKTRSINNDVFENGYSKQYDTIGELYDDKLGYYFITDLTFVSQNIVDVNFLFSEKMKITLKGVYENYKRNSTYLILPHLNRQILELMLIRDEFTGNDKRWEPTIVTSISEALFKIKTDDDL